MAEVAPAPAAAPDKAPKKKAASRTKKTGPSVGELIVKAVSSSKERNGVSLAALKKALAASRYDVMNNSCVKLAVKGLVTKGILVQTKGTGASVSFKLNKKQTEVKKPAKKAAPKGTKAAAKNPAAAKKPKKVAAKKPAAKKSPKKTKKPVAAVKKATKSPKKAKKPATPKKAAKSPKRAKKPATPKKVKAVKPKAAKAKKAPKKK
ncbi:histone H1-like [Tachysurus fulvidraco]|uniref:histone H1-like n=1 Tax=Tachysurus fulvidraco TaxID=1234273 RepID=UPI001FEE6C43|nr:histone H1-like [Tachysurus fulvidraco]